MRACVPWAAPGPSTPPGQRALLWPRLSAAACRAAPRRWAYAARHNTVPPPPPPRPCSKNLTRSVGSPQFAAFSAFPASQRVTYKFYLGRLAVLDENFVSAGGRQHRNGRHPSLIAPHSQRPPRVRCPAARSPGQPVVRAATLPPRLAPQHAPRAQLPRAGGAQGVACVGARVLRLPRQPKHTQPLAPCPPPLLPAPFCVFAQVQLLLGVLPSQRLIERFALQQYVPIVQVGACVPCQGAPIARAHPPSPPPPLCVPRARRPCALETSTSFSRQCWRSKPGLCARWVERREALLKRGLVASPRGVCRARFCCWKSCGTRSTASCSSACTPCTRACRPSAAAAKCRCARCSARCNSRCGAREYRPPQALQRALTRLRARPQGVEADMDEVECVCANLVCRQARSACGRRGGQARVRRVRGSHQLVLPRQAVCQGVPCTQAKGAGGFARRRLPCAAADQAQRSRVTAARAAPRAGCSRQPTVAAACPCCRWPRYRRWGSSQR